MASAFARALPSSLSSRTLFLKCNPAPVTLTERRAVLKSLQGNVENSIEVFKRLGDSSSFIAVTAEAEHANSLIEESPLRRTIIVPVSTTPKTKPISMFSWGAAFRYSIMEPITPLMPDSGAAKDSVKSGLETKTFTLRIFPANIDYKHKRIIGLNALHGPWPNVLEHESFISAALNLAVPPGAMSPGLKDWETGGQLAGDGAGFQAEGALSLTSKVDAKAIAFAHDRICRREAERSIPDVMKSLCAIAGRGPAGPPSMQNEGESDSGAAVPAESRGDSDEKDVPGWETFEPLFDTSEAAPTENIKKEPRRQSFRALLRSRLKSEENKRGISGL